MWVCPWPGDADFGELSSIAGEEIEIVNAGTVALRIGDGGMVPRLGNGCRLPLGIGKVGAAMGLDGDVALALLSVLPRYSAIFSWKDCDAGEVFSVTILLRSSTD